MFDIFTSFFNIHKSERKGFLVLIIILLVLVGLNFTTPFFENNQAKELTFSKNGTEYILQKSGKVFEDSQIKTIEWEEKYQAKTLKNENSFITKDFDPNSASIEEMVNIGLRPKLAQNIHNYCEKGGKIKTPEDIKKIYSIRDNEIENIVSHIVIENDFNLQEKKEFPENKSFGESKTETVQNQKYLQKSNNPNLIIDINTADSLEWIEIKGIGPAFAHRIMDYRQKLGGFFAINQLREVYGMEDERFEEIENHLKVDGSKIILLEINTLDAVSLSRHPYLTYKEGVAIVNYRNRNGMFAKKEDLRKIILLKEETLQKVWPYLHL